MAHLVPIVKECARCPRTAVVRLHNCRNEPMADYCQHHGNAELQREKDRERAAGGTTASRGGDWTPPIDRDGR